jgi:hypothetical protein
MVKNLFADKRVVTIVVIVALIAIIFAAFTCMRKDEAGALIGRLTFANVPEKHKATAVKQFVDEAAKTANEYQGDRAALLKKLSHARSQVGGYLIAYQTADSPEAKKGTLIMHGVPTKTFCDADHPMCNAVGPSMVGKDLYDFETVGGVKEVQLWIDIARKGGGWAAAYWKNKEGQIKPKYYYIDGVTSKGFLLASGYFLD